MDNIYDIEQRIAARRPILEAERNRQFRLVSELKTDIDVGCQYSQPLRSFSIEVEGSVLAPVFLGIEPTERMSNIGQDGKASQIFFDFGGVTFTIDFATNNIFGASYTYGKDTSKDTIIGEPIKNYT